VITDIDIGSRFMSPPHGTPSPPTRNPFLPSRPLTAPPQADTLNPSPSLNLMAIRLEKAVIRGELSNEIRGQVTGRLWLLGRKDPLTFKLLGDCLRDLAGCVLSFENPNPEPLPHLDLLAAIQQGPVGDMTASRKARVPTVSESDLLDLLAKGKSIPAKLSNILYLEWFSDTNGRVVIEAPDFNVSLSEAFWKMDRHDGSAQELANQNAFHDYIDSITGMDPSDDDEEDIAVKEDDEGKESKGRQ
jgi:hypothetical protein